MGGVRAPHPCQRQTSYPGHPDAPDPNEVQMGRGGGVPGGLPASLLRREPEVEQQAAIREDCGARKCDSVELLCDCFAFGSARGP